MTEPAPLISEEYRRLQQSLHDDPNYGVASLGFAPIVQKLIGDLKLRSLCDYGAGKQNLRKALEAAGVSIDYWPYDPAFPEYGPARPAELVCCIDVLEHIELEYLDNVLKELARLTEQVALLSVHTGPATKTLADGRNAHLIQQPKEWWAPRLLTQFKFDKMFLSEAGFFVIAKPKGAT